MKIILLGAPGAGKGTQGENISKKYNIPTISTGEIIRACVKSGSELGKRVKGLIDAGKLVDDATVIDIIRDRLKEGDCQNGFILDGFPRTLAQAEALDRMGIDIDFALLVDVSDDVIVSRMSGRRVCPDCGKSYHIESKPAKDGVHCDGCGAQLVTRADDKPETVKARLKVYHDQTEPLIDYYRQKGKLLTVKGQKELKDTTALTFKTIEGYISDNNQVR
jgi:adenylate kinases